LENTFIVNKDTILRLPEKLTPAVGHAVEMFQTDAEKVLGKRLAVGGFSTVPGGFIVVDYADPKDEIAGRPEAFAIRFSHDSNSPIMRILGSDDLGIIYGLLRLSHDHLDVDPFWFWTEKEPLCRMSVFIPNRDIVSTPARVRYRGWFVNDEDCLIGWTDIYPPPKKVWRPVFETLLRCGGNLWAPRCFPGPFLIKIPASTVTRACLRLYGKRRSFGKKKTISYGCWVFVARVIVLSGNRMWQSIRPRPVENS